GNEIAQRLDRLYAVEGIAKLCTSFDALGVIPTERANLVDNPAVVALITGFEVLASGSGGGGRRLEARGWGFRLRDVLAHAFVFQQRDVVEQELSALGISDGAWLASAHEIRALRQNPRIAQDAASNQHAGDAALQLFGDL